jgi:hypothetical protein
MVQLLKLLAAMAIVLVVCSAGWVAYNTFTPVEDNPFRPLDLTLPVGSTTAGKLALLKADRTLCLRLLADAGVDVTPLAINIENPKCSLEGAVTLDRSTTPYSQTLSLSCPLAATLYVWERQIVIPAAKDLLGETPERIETFGSYSCRPVRGGRSGRWSEHATANAVDISGFRFADRKPVMVAKDFRGTGPEAAFLKRVRRDGCRLFRTTLGPDYNALHHDHFHLDMGAWSSCS